MSAAAAGSSCGQAFDAVDIYGSAAALWFCWLPNTGFAPAEEVAIQGILRYFAVLRNSDVQLHTFAA